jgi:hypothetical protein
VTSRRLEELAVESTGESFASLMARQSPSAEQVVGVAADIAKQMASMHRRGLTYGALQSSNIRISAGHASLEAAAAEPGRHAADDVHDFELWLRELVQALPEAPGDRRRNALAEIADRYLQPEDLSTSSQMRKAAMALALLRVASHRMAPPEVDVVRASAPPLPPIRPRRKGRVLLLVRVVPGVDRFEIAGTKFEAPSSAVPWYAAAIMFACVLGVMLYFLRGIL